VTPVWSWHRHASIVVVAATSRACCARMPGAANGSQWPRTRTRVFGICKLPLTCFFCCPLSFARHVSGRASADSNRGYDENKGVRAAPEGSETPDCAWAGAWLWPLISTIAFCPCRHMLPVASNQKPAPGSRCPCCCAGNTK
jgi:hypothetical protein